MPINTRALTSRGTRGSSLAASARCSSALARSKSPICTYSSEISVAASDSTAGFNIGLNYEVETADGTTGTRTAVSSTTGTWS